MKIARTLKLALAMLLHLLLRTFPVRPHVVVTGWPADEGNVVEMVRGLIRRYRGRIVWLDPPAPPRLRTLGLDPHRIQAVGKLTLQAVRAYLTAEAVFFTHGLYFGPKPSPRKALINLWHGDGPKGITGSVVPSTYLVSGSRIFAQPRVDAFDIASKNLLLTGLPRTEQLRWPASATNLQALGLDPALPFVVWMPTFRRARGGGLDGAWCDTGEISDRQVTVAIRPVIEALNATGIQVLVKPHPLDQESRQLAGVTVAEDSAIAAAGTTLYSVLGASAGLITDYSSVWTDYLVTDRPIAFFLPDQNEYVAGRGLYPEDVLDHLPGLTLSSRDDAATFAQQIGGNDDAGAAARQHARDQFGLVTNARPTEALLDVLAERGVMHLTTAPALLGCDASTAV